MVLEFKKYLDFRQSEVSIVLLENHWCEIYIISILQPPSSKILLTTINTMWNGQFGCVSWYLKKYTLQLSTYLHPSRKHFQWNHTDIDIILMYLWKTNKIPISSVHLDTFLTKENTESQLLTPWKVNSSSVNSRLIDLILNVFE